MASHCGSVLVGTVLFPLEMMCAALNQDLLSLEMCKYSDCKSKLVPEFAGKGMSG